MKQPPCSYIIQVQCQPCGDAAAVRKGRAATITTSTVRVGDQAELVSLLTGMHRDGVLILSVRHVTFLDFAVISSSLENPAQSQR